LRWSLRSRSGTSTLLVRATPADRAQKLLEELLGKDKVRLASGQFHISVDPSQAGSINRRLVTDGLEVTELRASEQSLEDVFLQLTETPERKG